MRIETLRLLLTTWDEGDWEHFKPIATDPRVMRFITGGDPWTDERIQYFVDQNRNRFRERGFCRWKLVFKETGKIIGFCGVGFLRDEVDPEIGWWLAVEYWGRGLATEAARAAFQDAKERVRLERIISIAHPDNTASIHIMQKLGLCFEKHCEYMGRPVVKYVFDSGTAVRRQ